MHEPLAFYKSLAEETRLKSLLLIKKKERLCVCDLMNALQLSQPKVSRHLAELRKHGLVMDERCGKWVYYQLHPQLPEWMDQVLQLTLIQNPSLIAAELNKLRSQLC